ncbi:hypothetical protein J5N97_009561 [Dioscorea zingiberensis]|uniref:RING-type E3 ubiquitin transferase n=1 Tax=Dioscorea zingiberensis TaxID=325984 RepID=A0A9D5CX43_9LILI|nr:hypothetical protein J5N97_009561 [Dioscorea zingiberensis]
MAAAVAAPPVPASEAGKLAEALLIVLRDVSATEDFSCAPGPLRDDCVRLARKFSLLSHLLEEIRDFTSRGQDGSSPASSSRAVSPVSCLVDLLLALDVAKSFIMRGRSAGLELAGKNIAVQFQYVTWQLEKVLVALPFDYFGISDEVQEEVELVCAQLRRATEKCGTPNLKLFSEIYHILSRTHSKEFKRLSSSMSGRFLIQSSSHGNRDFHDLVLLVSEVNGNFKCDAQNPMDVTATGPSDPCKVLKSDTIAVPEDFRCPISLELMRDPVIVSTGQTYERSSIQKWIDCGNGTCPKTQQKLQNLTLTPNYALRSLIMQWCEDHKVEQLCRTMSGGLRKSFGVFHEDGGNRFTIDALVHKLSSRCNEERNSAAAEIRSLAKRNAENRILIAKAGAIPTLVDLLSEGDLKIQEHAVTSILNLSIHDDNKVLIVLAGAIDGMIQVLRSGSMEARENAAATIFSLSLVDENKITIGSTPGAIEALVKLLDSGSSRGKKDAATALFNLCIYRGNKTHAIRAGVLIPLLKLLKDSSRDCMVDEALTILSVLVSHQEGKAAIVRANTIPILIDLLRIGQPRSKENAAAILLAICKKDAKNLAYIGRLGAIIPLTELANSGTDRAKRKSSSLLEHLRKLHDL